MDEDTSTSKFSKVDPAAVFPYVCLKCHHIVGDQKALDDHIWLCSTPTVQGNCQKHLEVLFCCRLNQQDQEIHETFCNQLGTNSIFPGVEWKKIWENYKNEHLHMSLLPPVNGKLRVVDEGYYLTNTEDLINNKDSTIFFGCEERGCKASVAMIGKHTSTRLDPCIFLRSKAQHNHYPNSEDLVVTEHVICHLDLKNIKLKAGPHIYKFDHFVGDRGFVYRCSSMCSKRIYRINGDFKYFPVTSHYHRPSYTDFSSRIQDTLMGKREFEEDESGSSSDSEGVDESEYCLRRGPRDSFINYYLAELESFLEKYHPTKSVKTYLKETCEDIQCIFKPRSFPPYSCILPEHPRAVRCKEGVLQADQSIQIMRLSPLFREMHFSYRPFCSFENCWHTVTIKRGGQMFDTCHKHIPQIYGVDILKLKTTKKEELGFRNNQTAYAVLRISTGASDNGIVFETTVKVHKDLENVLKVECRNQEEEEILCASYIVFLHMVSMKNESVCCINKQTELVQLTFLMKLLEEHSVNFSLSRLSGKATADHNWRKGFKFKEDRFVPLHTIPEGLQQRNRSILYMLYARDHVYIGITPSLKVPDTHFRSRDGVCLDATRWGSFMRSQNLSIADSRIIASVPSQYSFLMETYSILVTALNLYHGIYSKILRGRKIVNSKLLFPILNKHRSMEGNYQLLRDLSLFLFGSKLTFEVPDDFTLKGVSCSSDGNSGQEG